jgi:HTH-type transcriptional regulator/antitoxin HigA
MAHVGTLDEEKYGRLLTKHRPRVTQSDEDFDRLAADLEALDALQDTCEDTRELDPEELELQALLAHLCTEYEDRTVAPPDASPLEVLKFLMEQNGLRPVDLLDIFGSRAVASQVLNGKRELSKNHARALASRFQISMEAFI